MVSLSEDPIIRQYFEDSSIGLELEEDGLKPMQFGEFLVEKRLINREQLFRALSAQDTCPGVRIGEVVAALGFLPYAEVDRLVCEFLSVPAIEIS